MFLLKLLDRDVCIHCVTTFKTDKTREAGCLNGFKDVDIIQFACAGLLPTRVVCNVVVINTVDIAGCIADNIALRNLLVVVHRRRASHSDCQPDR